METCRYCGSETAPLESTVSNRTIVASWPYYCGAMNCVTRLTGETVPGPVPGN